MSEEFGSDFLSIVDDEGNEYELELLDTLEHNGVTYHALIEADRKESDLQGSEEGLIILKVIEEDGEEFLSTPDTDEELDEIYDLFMERVFEEEGEQED